MADEKVAVDLSNDDVTVALGTEPPPSYDATAAASAPPSYQSIYGKLKETKEQNENPVSFMGALLKLLIGTLCFTIMQAIILAIPITMIVIGAKYKEDCPVEKLIPIYLITMGSVYIAKNLIDLTFRVQKSRLPANEQESFEPNKCCNGISNLIGLFTFAFFIAGNVWIYRIYAPNTSDATLPEYCNPVLYYFAFWVTTAAYIFMLLGCCCACFAGCIACAGSK